MVLVLAFVCLLLTADLKASAEAQTPAVPDAATIIAPGPPDTTVPATPPRSFGGGGAEAIPLELPAVDKLLPVGAKLPAIRLEANFTQPISMREALTFAVDYNLPIAISKASVQSQKWLWVGSMGKFLPNLLTSYQQMILQGTNLVGGVIPVSFHTPNVSTQAGFQFYGFQGGSVLFGMLSQLHTWKASKASLNATINDVLLQIAQLYYSLQQNQALLQIQTRAVETSRAQLILTQQLERAGTGTRFQVLQSETQLATDEQNLLNQEVALRNAAIQLAAALNLNMGINLLSVEGEVRKVRLFDPELNIDDLIKIAILNRPELKQYEHLRIAARRNIQVAAAPLYPQFQLFGSVAGNGATLTNTSTVVNGSFTPVPIGPPLEGISVTNNANLPGQVYAAGLVYNPAQVARRQVKSSYTLGFGVNWSFPGMGIPSAANIQSNKALARQVMLQANQQLIAVLSQVRLAYLNSQTAEKLIDVASKQVVSSQEQLRLSKVRLANGVGTNLDVISAQQAYTTALVNKANAIIQFNTAQAKLLRDIGIISVDTLTSGRLVRK